MVHSENSSAIALGRRPPATAASSSNEPSANIENFRTPTPGPGLCASAHPTLLSTLLRPAFKGDDACCALLAHLKHTAHASLHAGTAHSTHLHVLVEPHAPHSHDQHDRLHVSVSLPWPSLSCICRLFRRAQPRLTSAILACVILAGSSICRTIYRSIFNAAQRDLLKLMRTV